MKKLTNQRILTIFILLLIGKIAYGQNKKDTIQVNRMSIGTVDFFYKYDLVSFKNLYDKNAIFINVGGLIAKGQDQIIDLHKKWVIDTTTILKYEQPITNFITKDFAISYIVWGGLVFNVEGMKKLVQSGYLTNVFQRKKSGWKIISSTNAYNITGQDNFKLIPYTEYKW